MINLDLVVILISRTLSRSSIDLRDGCPGFPWIVRELMFLYLNIYRQSSFLCFFSRFDTDKTALSCSSFENLFFGTFPQARTMISLNLIISFIF